MMSLIKPKFAAAANAVYHITCQCCDKNVQMSVHRNTLSFSFEKQTLLVQSVVQQINNTLKVYDKTKTSQHMQKLWSFLVAANHSSVTLRHLVMLQIQLATPLQVFVLHIHSIQVNNIQQGLQQVVQQIETVDSKLYMKSFRPQILSYPPDCTLDFNRTAFTDSV